MTNISEESTYGKISEISVGGTKIPIIGVDAPDPPHDGQIVYDSAKSSYLVFQNGSWIKVGTPQLGRINISGSLNFNTSGLRGNSTFFEVFDEWANYEVDYSDEVIALAELEAYDSYADEAHCIEAGLL